MALEDFFHSCEGLQRIYVLGIVLLLVSVRIDAEVVRHTRRSYHKEDSIFNKIMRAVYILTYFVIILHRFYEAMAWRRNEIRRVYLASSFSVKKSRQ
jgi:hypothetical protein